MPRVTLPIANGFYLSDSLPISAQECVNWRVNIAQVQGALSAESLFGCAGTSQMVTTGAISCISHNGRQLKK